MEEQGTESLNLFSTFLINMGVLELNLTGLWGAACAGGTLESILEPTVDMEINWYQGLSWNAL